MRCPLCGANDNKVIYTRRSKGEIVGVHRQRECKSCRRRFSTLEVAFGSEFLSLFKRHASIRVEIRSLVKQYSKVFPDHMFKKTKAKK